jgi:hypothetical protein
MSGIRITTLSGEEAFLTEDAYFSKNSSIDISMGL